MLKLQTNTGVICTGVVYIFLVLAFGIGLRTKVLGSEYFCILELLGAAGLLFGVRKQNPLFFLPWLIFTGLFLSFLLWLIILTYLNSGDYICVIQLLTCWGILLVPFFSVIQAFIRIHRDRSARGSCNVVVTEDLSYIEA